MSCATVAYLLILAAACDKHDDDPRDPAHPRCGHLLPNTHLFDICVDHPFPTTLHPATDTGANTISCWINDTIAFRNWRPWLMGRPDAEGRRQDADSNFQIIGVYENFEEIDKRRITIYLPLSAEGGLRTNPASDFLVSGFGELSGTYVIDHSRSNFAMSHLDDGIIHGSFELLLLHRHDSTKTLHLTDGRFDVKWYWF